MQIREEEHGWEINANTCERVEQPHAQEQVSGPATWLQLCKAAEIESAL